MEEHNEKQPARVAYRIHEAAEATGLSSGMVKKAIRAKQLRARHVGRAVVIMASDLEAWLRGQEQHA